MDDGDARWREVSAGLVVLRLFDAWVAEGSEVVEEASWGLTGVLEAVEAIDQRSPIRRVLSGIVDAMRSAGEFNPLYLHVGPAAAPREGSGLDVG